jgi:hypothetical protein
MIGLARGLTVSKQDDRWEEVKWQKSPMSSGSKRKKAPSGTGMVFAFVMKNMRFRLHLSVANLTLHLWWPVKVALGCFEDGILGFAERLPKNTLRRAIFTAGEPRR